MSKTLTILILLAGVFPSFAQKWAPLTVDENISLKIPANITGFDTTSQYEYFVRSASENSYAAVMRLSDGRENNFAIPDVNYLINVFYPAQLDTVVNFWQGRVLESFVSQEDQLYIQKSKFILSNTPDTTICDCRSLVAKNRVYFVMFCHPTYVADEEIDEDRKQLLESIALNPSLAENDQIATGLTTLNQDMDAEDKRLYDQGMVIGEIMKWVIAISVLIGIVIYITLFRIKRNGGNAALAKRLIAIFKTLRLLMEFFFFGFSGVNLFSYLLTVLFDVGVGSNSNLTVALVCFVIGFVITRIKLQI